MKTKINFREFLLLFLVLGVGIFFVATSQQNSILLSPDGLEYESHNMTSNYQAGDLISGTLNLTLNGARGDYIITNNLNNQNITLLDFLKNNNADYECSTATCEDDYSSEGTINSLEIDDEGKTVGFIISGQSISQVSSAKLTLNSNAGNTCGYSQLKIDVLNDGENILVNDASSGQLCSSTYSGCFNQADSTGDVEIDSNRYCERILLPAAPAFQATAKVKNSTQGKGDLEMEIYPTDDLGASAGKCNLPKNSQNGIYESLSCIINHTSSESQEYFVCIRKKSSDNSNYKIRFETKNVCGTNSIGGFGNNISDYDISAKAMQFGSINNLILENNFEESYSFELADYISSYISEIYNGNCQPNCAIPIKFSGEAQTLSFSNSEIKYTAQQGTVTNNEFHELSKNPVEITSDEISLDLEELEFTIPQGSDEDNFELFIDGESIFDEDINIQESFDFDITPKFVAFGQEVAYSAIVTANITSSEWTFGSGTPETSSNKKITHRYTGSGNSFNLKVTLTRSDGIKSTKTFAISVGDAKEIANATLRDYSQRISNLDKQIKTFPTWIQTGINDLIDLSALNTSLNQLKNNYNLASGDEEYQEVMVDLINLKIPESINVTRKETNIPLLIGFDNIDVSAIEQISSKTVEDTSNLKTNIGGWMNEYYDARINYEQISAIYDEPETLLSKFLVNANSKGNPGYASYLIFGYDIESGGDFMTDYNEKLIFGSTYIVLNDGETKRVEFYIIGDFEPEELGAYISPEISQLGNLDNQISPCDFDNICEAGEDRNNCPADCGSGRWGWFIIWMVILLFIALIAYIALQEWYKRHYEIHLFKSKDDMYNLVNYVYNARKSGVTDRQSKDKLKKSGWTGEQIKYIYRKIDGRRTGMYEIPLFKFVENRKVKSEIAKRQSGKVDAKFIKQNSLEGI